MADPMNVEPGSWTYNFPIETAVDYSSPYSIIAPSRYEQDAGGGSGEPLGTFELVGPGFSQVGTSPEWQEFGDGNGSGGGFYTPPFDHYAFVSTAVAAPEGLAELLADDLLVPVGGNPLEMYVHYTDSGGAMAFGVTQEGETGVGGSVITPSKHYPLYAGVFDGTISDYSFATQDVTVYTGFAYHLQATVGPDLFMRPWVSGAAGTPSRHWWAPIGVADPDGDRARFMHILELWAAGNLRIGIAAPASSTGLVGVIDRVMFRLDYGVLVPPPLVISGQLKNTGRRFKTSRVPIW